MTRIGISLDPSIIAPDLPAGADTRLETHKYYLDRMGEALGSERGIKLIFASTEDAKGARFRYYRARRYVARQGVTSFDRLIFLVEGSALLIKKELPPEVELL